MDIWLTPAPGRCGCCPCCRRAGTGRARSWPGSCRSRRARCAGTSTGCASSATPSRRSAAGRGGPRLVVDDEEAVAVALGLQTAAQGAVEGIAESSVRALAKVVQVMPARLRRRVQALGAMTVPAGWETMGGVARETVDPEGLTTLALARRDTERIRFSYTAAGGQQTGRHVEPHRLVLLGRRWYLAAYDLDRHGGR